MHITITGVHLEVTEAIREYITEKFEPLVRYLPKDDMSARFDIEISKTTRHHAHGDIFRVHATLHKRGTNVTLEVTEDDLYKAIDISKDKMTRELTDKKDKEISLFRRGAHKVKKLLKRQ